MANGPAFRDRVKGLRRVRAGDLLPNPLNGRRHSPAQAAALKGVLAEVGFAGAVIAYEGKDGLVTIDGHLRAGLSPDAVRWLMSSPIAPPLGSIHGPEGGVDSQ